MGWKRLARHVVANDGDQVAQFSFDACDYLKVVAWINKQGTGDFTLYPNAVTSGGNSFTARYAKDFANTSANNNHIGIHGNYGQLEGDCHAVYYISNIDGEEKLIQWTYALGASGNSTPDSFEATGKYTTKTGQITSLSGNIGSGGFGAGSTITVYGKADDVVTDEKETLADATAEQSTTQSYNSTTTNVTLSNSNLTATSTSTAWGNRAYSTLSYNPSNLTSGQTYEFKFTMGDITKNGFMGFDSTPTTISGHGNDNNASGVDYGFYLVGNGSSNNYLAVSEQGTEKWQSSSNFITSNTIFKITVDSSGVVKYYADATDGTTLRYTSGTAMSGDFYVLFYPYDSGFTTTITSWSNGLETVSTAPNAGTQYRETDTRKLYRFKASTLVNSTYTEDMSDTTGWTFADTGAVNVTGGSLSYTLNRNGSNDSASYDFGSTISDTKFILRFSRTPTNHSHSSGSNCIGFFGMSDNTSGQGTSQDFIGFNFASNDNDGCTTKNGTTLVANSVGNHNDKHTSGTKYYEIKRNSATEVVFTVYNNSDFTGVYWTKTEDSLSSSITSLRYFKFANWHSSGSGSCNVTGTIDDLELWNNVNSAGEPTKWVERGTA